MGEELFNVLTVQEAREKMASCLPAELRRITRKSLLDCLGMRLAHPVVAREDVPGFARSTVDGYAVRAEDTFGASEGLPAFFTVTGEVRPGVAPERGIAPGEAMRVATGAMLPPGADAAVMVEYTEEAGEGCIEVLRPVGPGENILRPDEDIKAGEEVFPGNHLLRPQDIGYLASIGEVELDVFAPLRVGIISTGDELVPPEEKPRPGEVRDINSYTLYSMVRALGGAPVLYGVVRDDTGLLENRLREACRETDLVVISGGSSVGTRDHTAGCIAALGEPGLIFHGLAVRPGKPTLGGVVGGKPVFGLPGHPAAALISFDLLVSPLLKFGGYRSLPEGASPVKAVLARSLGSAPGREEYFRVKLRRDQGRIWADPILGKSGLLTPMVEADGIVRIPLESEGLAQEAEVDVYLFGTDYVL
ncbi:MAG: molybdopterin molybdotransferase [Clostridia bacterium]|jgi:molybdopterin molybdotransferase|nr:molybdopterin molybdotransferase [Clostridia bacterium]MDN5365140.1 molybdopterin molybdotransferase [Thermacetogenium sp.]